MASVQTSAVSSRSEIADRIAVMYAGRIVEIAPSRALFSAPLHPYTRGLMGSFPSLSGERKLLYGIPGCPPDLVDPPPGCPFHPRCPDALPGCRDRMPPLEAVGRDEGHRVACFLAKGGAR